MTIKRVPAFLSIVLSSSSLHALHIAIELTAKVEAERIERINKGESTPRTSATKLLWHGIRTSNFDHVEAALLKDADLTVTESCGKVLRTPLEVAVRQAVTEKNNKLLLAILAAKGLVIDQRNTNGMTALWYAIDLLIQKRTTVDVVQPVLIKLIEAGASTEFVFEYLEKNGHQTLAEALAAHLKERHSKETVQKIAEECKKA